jgi:hypothetical protein
MAKPSWITVVSGSTGSGSGTRSLKASSHTGRSSRSGSIKGVTSGGASDSVVLLQVGAGEFIRVDKTSYSVAALGGTVKITGTSNSPSLKLTNLTDSSLLSNFTLKVNGTAYSWDGNVSHQISGDPGASSSYTFEISFDVAENQTENSRDITFRLRDSGDPGVSSKTITITQTEGEKTYGTASVYMSYSNWDIGAEGGIATPSYGFSIPWGWNGKTSGGGTLTQSNSSHSVKYTYYTDPPGSPYNWTLNEHTGELVMDSLGKNITDSYKSARIKITIIVNGQTLTHTDFVRQDPNKVTYTLSSASVSLDDIPASGGSADSPSFISASGKIDYSSGESDTPSITSSDVIITLSKTVNGSNLGSTIKARTKLDTVTATINWNGSQITQSIDVYQQANQVTYSSVNATSSTVIIPKTGGDVDIAAKVSPNQTATYTSGATRTITDFTYEFTSVPSLVTIDELNLKATVGKNITGLSRDDTIKMKITGEGNKSTTASISYHQESLVRPSWDVPATFRFDSNGQSGLSPSGLDLNISDPDNVGWIIDGPSYVGNSLVSGDPLPISGTGNKSLSLAPGVNTSSERTFDLVLKASTGDVIATCNCTQDASESENTVAMKIAISNADQVLDVVDHNPEVCINTNGLTITDGLSLGTIVSMDSQYIYIDIPKSNVAELYNKLMVDWKYNQFLYVHILNGSTNPDTVYNNETSEHTDFYNNENFLLCEIAKVQADLFTKVENVVTSHGSIILESDCIIEEYQTRYHAVIKTDESWVSKVSSQFSSEKFGLVWLMNRDNNTIYLPIFPYVTGVDAGESVPKLRMDVYRCIPMPLSVFKLNNLAFVTDFAATESTQVGIVSISEIKTGNLSLSNLPTFVLSETYFGTEVPGFDSSVVLEMQNPSVLDLSNHVSTAFKGDIIITLNCDDLFLDIS